MRKCTDTPAVALAISIGNDASYRLGGQGYQPKVFSRRKITPNTNHIQFFSVWGASVLADCVSTCTGHLEQLRITFVLFSVSLVLCCTPGNRLRRSSVRLDDSCRLRKHCYDSKEVFSGTGERDSTSLRPVCLNPLRRLFVSVETSRAYIQFPDAAEV